MEGFQSSLSELHNVPFSIDCNSSGSVSESIQSTRSILSSHSDTYNSSEKNYQYSSLPHYQQSFHYQFGNPAMFSQASSTRHSDKSVQQYQDMYRAVAVDMTNRSGSTNEIVKNPNGIAETLNHAQTEFLDNRLYLRKSGLVVGKQSRTKHSLDTEETAYHIKRLNQNNFNIKNDLAKINDISSTKGNESENLRCEEKTDDHTSDLVFNCGGCQQSFSTICKLHAHIITHNQSGSYYYSELTKTGYPKFDSCCTAVQTEEQNGNCIDSETLNIQLGSCSSGTQTDDLHVNANQNGINKTGKSAHRYQPHMCEKEDEEFSSYKQESLNRDRIDVGDDLEIDEEKIDIKEEIDDSEYVANINSTVKSDSETDEYSPEENMAQRLMKRKKDKSKDSKRKKCKGNRKLKMLKMTVKLKQEERKEKRKSFRSKDKKPKSMANKMKIQEKITCKLCDIDFPKKLYLRHHIRAKHSDVANLCQLCSDSFTTNEDLLEHRRSVHNRGHYKCELCDKVLSTKGMLEGHYLIHKGIKPFACSVCVPKKEFTRKCQLKAHMETHSAEKTLQCEFCGKPFSARYLMLSHVKHCGGIKPHKCDFCEMSFVSNHCLQRHRRTHTGEKPFICEVCAFASSNASCLARHMRIHTGEKPFTCQYCKQTFAARGALKKHVRIHTQEKPYKCRFCTKAFTQNWNLKTHERQHTGETPYKCHVCGVGYKQNVLLKTHLKTHFAPDTDVGKNHFASSSDVEKMNYAQNIDVVKAHFNSITEVRESHPIASNSSVSQFQNESQSTKQNQSVVNLQTGSKPEILKGEFSQQQHCQSHLVEFHAQPLVPNLLLTSFLHSGYNVG